MEERKRHQLPLTVDQQIKNLKSLGLIIDDEDYAERTLRDISYFRLIKAYSPGLKPRNGSYRGQTRFEQIVDLYLFDAHLRHIIYPEIERVEIYLRCRLSNHFSIQYGVLGYLDDTHCNDKQYHEEFLKDVQEEIRRNYKTPFVRNYSEHYEGGQLPFYALVEILSFGTLSKFYKNMLAADKKAVAQTFGIGYTYLESWIESISYVRNVCAHYGRLYNTRLTKRPMMYKEYKQAGIDDSRMFAVLLCMRRLLAADTQWNQFVVDLAELIERYQYTRIDTMGFPENWLEMLR